jgi:hypothetical protein
MSRNQKGGGVSAAEAAPMTTINIFLNHDVMIYGINDSSGYDFAICDSSYYDVTICVINASSGHDVTACFNVYANYNDSPMTTCDNSTVDGTIGHGDIKGFYAYRDLYDEDFLRTTCNDTTVYGMGGDEVTERSRDDIAMKIYFSACDGQKHDYALLGYFCACSQNFDFIRTWAGC